MRLARPLFSDLLASSAFRTAVRTVEAGLVLAGFRVLMDATGWLFGEPVAWPQELRRLGVMLATTLVGGIVYALLLAAAARLSGPPTRATRVLLAMLVGAGIGALSTFRYWRRVPAPGEFSHVGLTVLATILGMMMALALLSIAAWQQSTDRARGVA